MLLNLSIDKYTVMKINEVFNEAMVKPYQHDAVDPGSVIELLQRDCSEFFENNLESPLWRGSSGNHPIVRLVDPSQGVRKSENISNHYTQIMDHSPYYKGWPPRSNSLICSTSYARASQYGKLYAVIPFNGTKIGIARDSDIWLTELDFRELAWDTNFHKFARWMQSMGFPEEFEDMVWYGNSSTFANQFKFEFYETDTKIQPNQFIEYVTKCMDPYQLGFSLEDTSSFSSVEYENRECWFSDKCYMIEKNEYEAIVRELK